jgi:hypothetical protein
MPSTRLAHHTVAVGYSADVIRASDCDLLERGLELLNSCNGNGNRGRPGSPEVTVDTVSGLPLVTSCL